jgi:hypothetical protein
MDAPSWAAGARAALDECGAGQEHSSNCHKMVIFGFDAETMPKVIP